MNPKSRRLEWRPLLVATFLLALVAGCAQDSPPQAAKAKTAPKPHLVQTAPAKLEQLSQRRHYTGTLKARRYLRVFSQEEGRITALPYYEGDRVEQGSLLLRLDDSLLQAELAKASATRRQTETDLERLERLMRKKLVSEEELARARTAVDVARAEEAMLRTRLGYTVERAPFAGVIVERLAEPGDVVSRYTHVLTLTDPDSLVAEIPVSELVLPGLSIGDAVDVRIDALGDRVWQGRLLRIHPSLDARTRQGTVEVELTPVPEKAAAGQFARVTVTPAGRERLLIPFSTLRRDRQGEFVYRLARNGRVERVGVRSGEKLTNRIEVPEGLSEGDQVVVKGFLGLKDGMAVEVVEPGPATVAAGP
jgi:RND family efflux transporter MFP subunit